MSELNGKKCGGRSTFKVRVQCTRVLIRCKVWSFLERYVGITHDAWNALQDENQIRVELHGPRGLKKCPRLWILFKVTRRWTRDKKRNIWWDGCEGECYWIFHYFGGAGKGDKKDIWRRDYMTREEEGGDLFHMKKVFFPRPRGCKWTAHKAPMLLLLIGKLEGVNDVVILQRGSGKSRERNPI